MISLSIAVQHHPSRPGLPGRLASLLGEMGNPSHYEVVTDPEPDAAPSPWRTAQLAWERTPLWCTHRLVLQDDAIPCSEWRARVLAAIEQHPDEPLCMFVGQNAYPLGIQNYLAALAAGDEFYALPRTAFVPCVALVLQREQALDLSRFHLPHHDRPSVADDEVIVEWCHARGLSAIATVPSLFDHDDSQVSLMGTDPLRVRGAIAFDTRAARVVW